MQNVRKKDWSQEWELESGGKLPIGLQIKVVNPKAMVIVGRSNKFDDQQRLDFEIIRRKYANAIDILTYDDLLLRLDRQIKRLQGGR